MSAQNQKRSVPEMENPLRNTRALPGGADAVRKARAQLQLKLARKVKKDKKGFFRYINNKQKEILAQR